MENCKATFLRKKESNTTKSCWLKNETISDNNEIFEKLNNFCADTVKNLNIPQYEDHLVTNDNMDNTILRGKEKF